MKCKIKDLCDDLVDVYGVEEISLDHSGIGLAMSDYLKHKGVIVKNTKRR